MLRQLTDLQLAILLVQLADLRLQPFALLQNLLPLRVVQGGADRLLCQRPVHFRGVEHGRGFSSSVDVVLEENGNMSR